MKFTTYAARVLLILVAVAVSRAEEGLPLTGTVAETMDSGGYTYLRVTSGSQSTWVAGPRTALTVGDQVSITDGSFIADFHSPTLKRTFDRILFASQLEGGPGTSGAAVDLPPGHPPIAPKKDACCPSHGEPAPAHGHHGITGEVVELLKGGGYTYVKVRAADQTVWAATDRCQAQIGDRVTVPEGLLMTRFESPTLKRTFDSIYFVEHIGLAAP